MGMRWILVSFVAFVLVLPTSLLGVAHPHLERGFSPEKVFEVGDIDHVNIFNGNLAITIPIGGEYPIGGGFSYQLTLVYNAKLWEWTTKCGDPDGKGNQCFSFPEPNRHTNAGLGWELSLGRFDAAGSTFGSYIGPDGAEHPFFPDLHTGDPTDTAFYTRDGSYLRMQEVGSSREIEFPDGTTHRFDASGRLDWMRDRFGNELDVRYVGNTWELVDGNRTNIIEFVNLNMDGTSRPQVSKVTLAVPSGTAEYVFDYQLKSIARPEPFQNIAEAGQPLHEPERALVNVLKSVQLPDLSKYEIDPDTDYILERTTAEGHTGMLVGMRLPTRGRIEWTYGTYVMPIDVPTTVDVDTISVPLNAEPPSAQTFGVTERQLERENGTLIGRWTYAPSFENTGEISPGLDRWKMTRTVTTPLGDVTKHYFTAYNNAGGFASALDEPERWRTGLPFSSGDTIVGSGNETLFLSREVFAGASSLERLFYVRYERDQLIRSGMFRDQPWTVNSRVAQERVRFVDNGNNFTDVTRSNFDGLGNYRTAVTRSDITGGGTRTETTHYNPDAGTYDVDANTNNPTPSHDFDMLGLGDPWVLGTFTHTDQTEGMDTDRQTYCFESSTGFFDPAA